MLMKWEKVLEEIEKRKTKWEKLALIQMLLISEKNEEILKKLAQIKSNMEQTNTFQAPIHVSDAPKLEVVTSSATELETIVQSTSSVTSPPQESTDYLVNMESEYKPLLSGVKWEDEDSRIRFRDSWEDQGIKETKVRQRDFIQFIDFDVRGQVFNRDDELIKTDLSGNKKKKKKRREPNEI